MNRKFTAGAAVVLALALFPRLCQAFCCPQCSTTIESISPQVAIAGVTRVYVLGSCFGDTQGSGSVTINGTSVPAANFLFWADGELAFTVPFTASSGPLVITSGNGSDSSTNEADCTNWGWCGNGNINPTFTVVAPDNPPFYNSPTDIRIAGTPSVPQYVEGNWNYDDGYGDTATYTLSQGPQNSDGTWPVTGSVHWSYWYGQDGTCDESVTGTLDAHGDLYLNVAADPADGCTTYALEYVVLNSGDMTSQGISWGEQQPGPDPNFPSDLGTEYPYEPMFKAVTDLPASETPTSEGWGNIPDSGSQYPTYGTWQRTLPTSGDGLVEFAGRFVYEQNGGSPIDACWKPGSLTGQGTTLSGGGWYVDQNGNWGLDWIGIWSQGIDWYQSNVGLPCDITIPQLMHTDAGGGQPQYTTNQLIIEIRASEVRSEVQPQGGSAVKQCLGYPPGPGQPETCD